MTGALLAVALVGLVLFGMFCSNSYCTICGVEQGTLEWQIPFTRITYWQNNSLRDTPMSRALNHLALAGSHDHHWLAATGGGNGITCALGPGHHVMSAVHSAQVPAFLQAIEHYQGHEKAQAWVQRLLDPRTSDHAGSLISMSGPPSAGFASQQEFDRWWKEHHEILEDPALLR